LNVAMVDLDERITEATGRSPAQLIVETASPRFARGDRHAQRRAPKREATVIALGGGAWIQEANRA
jgi:shikimate kinase